MPVHRYRAIALLVVATIAVGCTSGGNAKPIGAGSTTTTTAAASSTASSTTSTTTAAEATTAAILVGYRAERAAFVAAADQNPVNPFDPRLAATMTGAELDTVRQNLSRARREGEYGVGMADLYPVVTGIDGATATVSDCLFDHSRIVSSRTGQTISGPDTERTLEHATLQFVDGAWRVATFRKAKVGCQPGGM